MAKKYILHDGQPIEEANVQAWAEWFESADKRVAYTKVSTGHVSTVFPGFDRNFSGGIPLLYETMIFCPGLECDQEQFRYATRDEAEKGHAQAVRMIAESQTVPARGEE